MPHGHAALARHARGTSPEMMVVRVTVGSVEHTMVGAEEGVVVVVVVVGGC